MKVLKEVLYKRLYDAQIVCILPLVAIIFQSKGIVGMMGLAGFFGALIYLAYNAVYLVSILPGRIPFRIIFWIGTFLIISGSMMDMITTVMHSPDLAREGNFMVLMLLEVHATLAFIYLFMLMFQIVFVTLSVSLWACFLKTYTDIVSLIPYKNVLTTFRWLYGAGQVSNLNWVFNRKLDPYFAISLMTIFLVMTQFLRWYVVLEWFEVIPIAINFRIMAVLTVAGMGAAGLTGLTHYHLKNKA